MIGLDTNILVRHLVADDPELFRRVESFLETNCTADRPGFVNRVVLCEVAWVLERLYGFDRAKIATAIEGLLRAAELRIEDHADATAALAAYRSSQADLADCLIGATNARAGCRTTITFDRAASNLSGFTEP